MHNIINRRKACRTFEMRTFAPKSNLGYLYIFGQYVFTQIAGF